MEFHKELDARGLTCPLPILRAKKALSDMHSGEVLKVLATDPGSLRDFQAFSARPATICWTSKPCRATGAKSSCTSCAAVEGWVPERSD